MAIQTYSTAASRNLIRAAQGMLAAAEPITVLRDFGETREMPKNSTDTLVIRRTLPFGASTTGTTIEGSSRYVGTPEVNANNFVLAEGSTPSSNTISFQDVTVTLQQYGVLFKLSSKVENLYEDNVSAEMQKQTGEVMAEVLESVAYGVLKAGSTVVYANGSSRSAVNTAISLNTLRKAARTLESNRARRVTSRLAPGLQYGTRAIKASYIVFIHTDMEADVRNLAGYVDVSEYGSFKPIHDREVGSCEGFRFISSPFLKSFEASGSGTLNGMLSVGSSNVDVYPTIIIGEQCWGQVALKGMGAIKPVVISANETNHANPLGQFGYCGASTYFGVARLNESFMCRVESGVSSL